MALYSLIDKVTGQPKSHKRKWRYEFGKTLGVGAFGIVREAINLDTQEKVAIKVIYRDKLKSEQAQNAIIEEFLLLDSLHHKHIVSVQEWFESKHKYYMVTQLCTGGELFDKIVEKGNFTERDASVIFRDLVSAVQYLHHRNIVHRDIKPENLLYEYPDEDGTAPLVLCDFGIAKRLMSSEDVIWASAGSLGYAAPEVFRKNGHAKPADIWSLGVVLYTTLSGVSPFQAETPEQFIEEVQPGFKPKFYKGYFDNVSDQVKNLITKMLDYNQETRITIDEIANDPWVTSGEQNSSFDLLPVVKTSLSARRKWRAAYERVLLHQMLEDLRVDLNEDEDGNVNAPIQSSDSDDSHQSGLNEADKDKIRKLLAHRFHRPNGEPGSRFMQVVAAAKAQNDAQNTQERESE